MKFESTSTPHGRPWWWLVLLPIIIPAFVFSFLMLLLGMAVIVPGALISGWRSNRCAEQKLKDEGRLIDWEGANVERGADNSALLVEITPKKVGNAWLVKLSPETRTLFESYPTYSEFEVDSRSVWEKYEKEDENFKQLIPHMLTAKRLDTTPEAIAVWDKELKDSARVVTVFDAESPFALLYASIQKKTNA
jgi:hypothetical protein